MAHLILALALAAGFNANSSSEVVWHWDSDVPICVLRQEIAATGGSIAITRIPAGPTVVEITVPLQSKLSGAQPAQGAIRLAPAGEILAQVIQQVDQRERQLGIYASTDDPTFLAKFAEASTLEIMGSNIEPLPITLKASAAAAEALGTCEDQKGRQWGIDTTALKALKSRPKPLESLPGRMGDEAYPHLTQRAALADSVHGTLILRLDIGADGKIHGCTPVNPAKTRTIEDTACDLIRSAKFQPALDTAGQAVPAPYIYYVRYQMHW